MIDECGISGVVYTEDTMSGVIDEGGSIQGQMDGEGNLVGEVGFPKCCCDYDELVNRPSINGVELVGNKTTEDLGIEAGVQSVNGQTGDVVLDIPTETSDLTNDSGFITDTEVPSYEQDPVFSNSVAHGITSSDITNWNNKSDFSGSYNDLTDKPTIPDVATKYDSNDSTETVLADDDKIPFYDTSASGQRNSTWANIKAKLKAYFDGIYSTFSGSYNDLTDKPTIPTVNNATLTIQENGVDVQTFTANASSDVTANITVPTDTSDLTNTAGFITSNDIPITDVEVNGTSVLSGTVAEITVPTDTSDLTNTAGFITSSDIPVTDVEVNGTSVLNDGVAEVTVPTTTSELTNNSLFARGHIAAFHGTCSTAAGTATKAVTCADFTAEDLVAGAMILVEFDNTNSAAVADLKLDVNGTGAKSIKQNNSGTMSNLGDKGYLKTGVTYPFIYNGTYWITWYDTNTNTIGYTIRTNGLQIPVKTACYRYRICFTSPSGDYLIPANASTSTSATASKTVTTEKIDPFGRIIYYNYTTAISAGGSIGTAYHVQQYNGVTLGYSFNRTGVALTMTAKKPVYVKCAPQTDGSAIIDADTPFVQDLPTTEDGKIYIFLGVATAATTIEFTLEHPVYCYKDGGIRQWTNASSGNVAEIVYCTCTDSASTVAKTATIVNGTLSSLAAGTIVAVKFDYQNTAASPTLDVGNTGAKSIKRYGTTAVGQNVNESWNAGSIVLLVYDGTNWIVTDFLNTTYTGGLATAITTGTDNLNYIWSPKQIHDGIDSMLPTIPTVNDATLTIQKNSTDVATFTANASSNVVADISVPTDTGDLTNGAGYITSADLPTDLSDLNNDLNVSDFNNDAGYITGMYIGSYGHSTYDEVLAAYQADKVVYCRASSNSNPAIGNQLRMAFLAYVNDQTTPTEFEFQYYRSVATHSNTQQGDQVYVYKLNKNTGWSVTVREAYTKIVAGSGLTSSYSNGVLTISLA